MGNDQHIQLVWDWIQNNREFDTIAENCCLVPVHSLKRLMFEKNISVAAVEEMLSKVQGYQLKGDIIPKKVAILYTAMYWKAPEEVVIHFSDRLTPDCMLDHTFIRQLSRWTKYSIRLWGRLVKCGGLSTDDLKENFQDYRPDLLSLFD